MGIFYRSNPKPTGKTSYHENVHARACIGEGVAFRWVNRRGEQVVEGELGHGKKAAVILYAGYLASGGDAKDDKKAALMLAKEVGMSTSELTSRARKYL